MTMMHDDDEMIMHDRDGGHHVKCTEIVIDDPEIVFDKPRSASPPFPRPRARTRTQTRHAPLSRPMTHRRTRQATGSQWWFRISRAGHWQPGPPRRREVVERAHSQATLEANPGRQPYQMVNTMRQRQQKTTQPHHLHRQPSHNARSPRWTGVQGPRKMRRDGQVPTR